MSVLEAGIRLYRWMPPRRKRCRLTPGCSELSLAAVQAGRGLREVIRILGTCSMAAEQGQCCFDATDPMCAGISLGEHAKPCRNSKWFGLSLLALIPFILGWETGGFCFHHAK